MPELKNARHESFVMEYAKDGNGTRSYKAVYGDVKGAAQSAKKLLELSTIRERLTEVRTKLAVAHGMSQDQIVQDFQTLYEIGKASPERGGLSGAQAAKFSQAKMLGLGSGKDQKPAAEMTDAELVKEVREGTGNDRLADLMAAALKHSMGEDISADLDRIEADLRQAAALSRSNGRDKQPPSAPTEN